ncbi:hypothetical protein BDA96_09G005900 [Sorghum bicolor]|uniref:Uncharacterized protein n=2 Tax=Sorghum bicolor TaxID=4558 RepID=A0A921Q6G7_SORBI|nr:hypothetical protein BDA96_09G005900 [Sorghum bicolor]OQU77201.1 hypothetical protein SORBI_3009G005750 [Sorghum bicolor]
MMEILCDLRGSSRNICSGVFERPRADDPADSLVSAYFGTGGRRGHRHRLRAPSSRRGARLTEIERVPASLRPPAARVGRGMDTGDREEGEKPEIARGMGHGRTLGVVW